MLLRQAPAVLLDLPLTPSAGPPSFPGLVSSLRPIKRLAAQLADEAALLRRFTYKHKNQHKGHGWWKRVVEIDRTAARALDELHGWLGGFGYSDGKDEAGLLTRESVCAGLLRLPRVMLIVEKNVAVLLNSASIFEQLVDSRAFLAFALVVVALASRLHALFSALFDECSRTAGTLLRLVEINQRLYRSAQKESLALPSPGPWPLQRDSSAFLAEPPALPIKKKKPKRPLPSDPSSRASTPSSLFPFALEPRTPAPAAVPAKLSAVEKPLKRVRTEQDGVKSEGRRKDGGEASKVLKRKKVKKREGDEIDAIFG
ncbi:hypothetical protein JCM10450v2_003770 [Rhodotorula kratochvilovae]